jgi:hypothetical protein
MTTNADYKKLKEYANKLKKKQVKRKNTQILANNKIKNLKQVKKTARYKNKRTIKGNTFFQSNKNGSLKKRQYDREFDDKFNNSEKIDINLERLLDSIRGGSLFGPSCGAPNIKVVGKKLAKIKSKDLKKHINRMKSSIAELSFTLNKLKLNYSNQMNVIRNLYNIEMQQSNNFEGVNIHKMETLKVELERKGYNKKIIASNIEILLKEKDQKYKELIKIKKKFDKTYVKYKKQYEKVVGKGDKTNKTLKKISAVILKYEKYKELSALNLEDPQSSTKKILRKGKKCEKKWKIIVDFYNDKFKTKDDVLNKALNLKSHNNQLIKFIEDEINKHKKNIATNEWEKDTDIIYKKLGRMLNDKNDKDEESLKYKTTMIKKLIGIMERMIDIIKQVGNTQLNRIIQSLEILLNFVRDVKQNFEYIKSDINKIFSGLLELNDYGYLKKIISNIITLHFQNVHKLLLVTFFIENIGNQDQFNVYTKVILGENLNQQTAINFNKAIHTQEVGVRNNPGMPVYKQAGGNKQEFTEKNRTDFLIKANMSAIDIICGL